MVVRVVDRRLLRHRLSRAHRRQVAGADFLIEAVVPELVDRIAGQSGTFEVGIASGGQTGALAEALLASGRVAKVIRLEAVAEALRSRTIASAVADEEALPLAAGSIDLFASVLSLQWANDLPGALLQIRRSLRPGGLFIAAMTGGQTLTELREVLFEAEF